MAGAFFHSLRQRDAEGGTMGEETRAPTTSQWKLRRLAKRSIAVFNRHAGVSGAIAAYQGSLIPRAEAYIQAYDAAALYEPRWRKEIAEGRGAMFALLTSINAWKPHLARELPGFDIATIGDKPTVPEDLVEDGERLADGLEMIVDGEGVTLPWATGGATELRTKADDAERETEEAAAADSTLSELLATVRRTGVELEQDLTLFRKTLRSVLGRSHPDFQKLRVEKASKPDDDDDPNGPQPSPPVTPAPEPPQG